MEFKSKTEYQAEQKGVRLVTVGRLFFLFSGFLSCLMFLNDVQAQEQEQSPVVYLEQAEPPSEVLLDIQQLDVEHPDVVSRSAVDSENDVAEAHEVEQEDVVFDSFYKEKMQRLLKKIRENWDYSIDSMPPLLFTYGQRLSILEAKAERGRVRPPTEEELQPRRRVIVPTLDKLKPKKVKKKPGIRYVSLGGIVYHGVDEWTIWLNDQRVTPNALPKEIMGLRVFEDYIEVKWYDHYTEQIFPLRLKSHQRFNMDMRLFLPG